MMSKTFFSFIFVLILATNVECNSEGDALNSWRTKLRDPNNVLQSWDPTLVNPCTWLHVTCNSDNSVTRVDLGNAGLLGILVPQLAFLNNLQYLYVFGNNLTGTIPMELGNLTNLVDLDLGRNNLIGTIPSTLGNLRSLRTLRLDDNRLTGRIPDSVIQLIQIRRGNLETLDVTNNRLAGTTRRSDTRGFRTILIIQDPKA